MPRTIIIGDVHGCLEELDELLDRLGPCAGDRLVFLGDLMDRGPHPVGVLRRVRGLGAECVYGNHEDRHVRWARHEAKRRAKPGYANPMKSMSEQDRRANAALTDEEVAWMAALPSWIELGDFVAVHAGFEPRRSLEAQKRAAVCRVRWVDADGRMRGDDDPRVQPVGTTRWAERWPGPASVVYGHHVMDLREPRIDRPAPSVEHWGIDTGCCYGGRLSALVLPERELVQVNARRAYVPFA